MKRAWSQNQLRVIIRRTHEKAEPIKPPVYRVSEFAVHLERYDGLAEKYHVPSLWVIIRFVE